ncbi:hypothetical protein CANARDRAFT_6883 [[Candida] arabinofermentans NRRL YB-2248]|uniref:Endoplasmic reticulum junction formation protein lunapark n=1 Tax=[Candida] arabinofermentans NRRL YB-2248 TaxID=983967 RepID=A0A1E4T417_9ASCO|nr:hypothetical protein CANARDRAFT_6883 [[Candida] arabinofermentans NRRL YB-2248]
MAFLSRSKGFNPDKFEKELKKITTDLSKTERRIKELKKNGSSNKWMVTTSLVVLYLSFVTYIYFIQKTHVVTKQLIHIGVCPVLIFILHRTIGGTYSYFIRRSELKLERVKDLHSLKMEELKEATNFHKTNELLSRFSNGEDLEELQKQADEINAKKQEYLNIINKGGKLPNANSENSSKVVDSVLGWVIGQDELSSETRYALICTNCYQHNGLAPPGTQPKFVKYICPKCGVTNGEEKPEEKKPIEPLKEIEEALKTTSNETK